MIVTFLGTGTSTGVPVVGCNCSICSSGDPRNKRLRQSAKIEAKGRFFLIDTTPDLRLQLLRDPIPRLDFVLFTHSHSDHAHPGSRRYLTAQPGRRLLGARLGEDAAIETVPYGEPVSLGAVTAKAIRRAFSYIWSDTQVGGGKPQLELHEVDGTFRHEEIEIVPLPVCHGDWTILGYRMGPFAYITDTNGIPASTMDLLRGVDTLALDGLRPSPPHPTHFTIGEAVEAAEQIGARITYLIHLTHDIDHVAFEATLPQNVKLAYDGLRLEFE